MEFAVATHWLVERRAALGKMLVTRNGQRKVGSQEVAHAPLVPEQFRTISAVGETKDQASAYLKDAEGPAADKPHAGDGEVGEALMENLAVASSIHQQRAAVRLIILLNLSNMASILFPTSGLCSGNWTAAVWSMGWEPVVFSPADWLAYYPCARLLTRRHESKFRHSPW